MDNYLKDLNSEQFKAVTFTTGPLLVNAGPGSGKTRVLTYRVNRLLENGISPKNILLLTFTNKAAEEMLKRVKSLDFYEEDENSEFYDGKITACTYHSFAVLTLRKYGSFIGIKNNFDIIDKNDSLDILSLLLENKDIQRTETFNEKLLLKIYDEFLNCDTTFEEIIKKKYDFLTKNIFLVKELFDLYNEYKKEKGLMTYIDLLFGLNKLLEDNKNICKVLSDRYKFIMVDEYQDSNYLQFQIIKNLRSFENKNIMVVGDDFQSIYSFNFSTIKNILNFSKYFDECTLINLDINYRSNQEIVNVCNNIIESGVEKLEKKIKALYYKKEKPYLIRTQTKDLETSFIINKIKNYKLNKIKLSDIVVLIRNSKDSTLLEVELNKNGIPYQKFGGIKLLEKKYIRQIFAFLKVSINENDELSWLKILTLYPNIGYKQAKKIIDDINKYGLDILNDKKYENKKNTIYIKEIYNTILLLKTYDLKNQLNFLIKDYFFNLLETTIINSNKSEKVKFELVNENKKNKNESSFLFVISKDYTDTRTFLTDIILETPNLKKDMDCLNISTIHSAKGLEYNIGFILDCVDGTLPCIRQQSLSFEEEEEERRLFYVAVSRIKDDLYILVPEYVFGYDRKFIKTSESRYLNENNIKQLFNIKDIK